ncbi:MAG: hypothetical protein KI790_21015, partial [Cyclobacteriaceae bacterium]|nr:hypothetical protein [Cyclobacteriaceae bacterium HetDA_MAG_MS6]
MLGKLFRVFLFSLVLIGTGSLSAQNFSDDPDKYIHEARGFLHQLNTEAANKVAFDLMNAWRAKFKEEHKEKILQISEKMRRKGYPLRPYYWHFFSYLAYSVEQEGIMSDQLNQVLDINLQVISTLSEQEYADFLFTLNVFFGRRYLFLERTSTARAPGGTYRFELLNAPEVIEEEVVEEEPVEEEEFITEEELQQTEVVDMSQPAANDPWSQPANDPWDQPANDPWSQPANDPWDSGNSDPWATSNDDPWATNSDDTWNSDDPWGTTEEETAYVEPAPVRQQVVPVIEDFVATLKSKYVHPALDGPVIHLDDVALVVSTPYDTLRFTKVKGAHLLGKRTFVGKQAELEWPGRNEDIRGAKVELAEFSMRVDRGELWTPNAKMKFPAWFAGEVEGAFRFKSIKRPKRALSTYPVFSSYKGGIKLDFPNGKATYKGGLEVQGNQVFGAAVSKELGELTILDGKGQTAIFRAERFTFNDSIITSDQASLTILHGDDSIYHPSVEMEYRASENKVMALRKKSHSVTPFHSTYFEMSMNADLLRWDMTADSLNLNILNGKDLVPATFESDDYFNELRYKRLTGYFGFHPIAISVHYCNKFGIKEFYTEELVNEYNVTQKMVEGAMRMLERYNFCDFDERTGHVSLFDNAFHYYESSAKRKDYDNLFIPSISPYEPNGTLSFGKGELRVHGAKKFFLTSDFAISVEPENEQVVLEEGRGLKYNGAIDAGD